MKTLVQFLKLSLVVLMLGLNACSKNDSDDAGNPETNAKGSYSFAGSTTSTNKGDYFFSDEDTYLFVYGSAATDIVQFIFPGTGNVIPQGNFTYNTRSNKLYDVKTNFAGGSVTNAQNPASVAITGGKVTISKTEAGYQVEFDCTTASGQLKGSYNGSFVSR